MKRSNGSGTIIKLSGNRRRPWACRKTIGFNEKGYPVYKYISYHATRREAEKALAEYNQAPHVLSSYTLKEVFEKMIEANPNKRDATLTNYRKAFKNFSKLHDVKMKDLSPAVIQAFLDENEYTKATLHHMRMILNQIVDYSVKRNILPYTFRDAVKNLDFVPKKETNAIQRRIFTREEISTLSVNFDDVICRIMLFYIYTGLRYSELQNITADCWHDNYIEIKNAKTAAGDRIVPLSDKAQALLPIPAMSGGYHTYRRAFDEVCVNVLHTQHTLHDTRHTFVSLLVNADVDSRVIKKIVGHKSDDVTEDIYTHISLERMLEAVNKI